MKTDLQKASIHALVSKQLTGQSFACGQWVNNDVVTFQVSQLTLRCYHFNGFLVRTEVLFLFEMCLCCDIGIFGRKIRGQYGSF